jgi:hypothetical protein
LDGYSRFLVHWDLWESMTEADIEIILERTKELYPGVKPRIISDPTYVTSSPTTAHTGVTRIRL